MPSVNLRPTRAGNPFICAIIMYRDPEPFDWYQRYSGLKDLIGQYVKKSDHILMSGCGNSRTLGL